MTLEIWQSAQRSREAKKAGCAPGLGLGTAGEKPTQNSNPDPRTALSANSMALPLNEFLKGGIADRQHSTPELNVMHSTDKSKKSFIAPIAVASKPNLTYF